MKAILALACIFSAVVLISAAFSKEKCEAPHAAPQCHPSATLRTTYHFNNGTRRCEEDFGCANGPMDFRSEDECRKNCPYGIYASSG
uniref:Putative salivary kunitz domain protein n=1 Tax=Ixodes ricinus TaxID=34613 RepID=A0A0K8R5M7_IXORI